MSDDPASLQNLHDVVSPAGVSWWPLAPGWYFLCFLVFAALIWFGWKTWKHWQENSYRRDALRALDEATSPLEVGEILRRTALVVASRAEISKKTGDDWLDWLESAFPGNLPDEVREQLTGDLYRPRTNSAASEALRSFVSDWIRHHFTPAASATQP